MNKKVIIAIVCFWIFTTSMAQERSQLYGTIKWQNGAFAKGVLVRIGGYRVVTNKKGYYKFDYLNQGEYTLSIKPPGKRTKSFKVKVTQKTKSEDFIIDW